MNRGNKYITALIDGEPVRVPKGQTVLDAARQAGIYIPTLCYLENLKSYGGCRLCIVKVKGSKDFPTACTTPLEPGMEILTKTPVLQSLRRKILEMTLSEHPYTCLVCKDKKECTDFMHTTRKAGTITGCNFCTSNGDCELQDLIDYLDLKDVRYPISYRGIPPEKNNPFYELDYNLCILCGRCVRICNEERNSGVLSFIQRGNSTIVGTAFGDSQAEAGCEFCGACVDVCPTGSISEKLGKWAGLPDRSTETTCTLCSVGCTMNVNTRGNRIVGVGVQPGQRIHPNQLCLRGKFLPGDITHHPERITTPLIRKHGKWVEVDWMEAIQYTAGRLKTFQGSSFGITGSAQDTLEEIYALQKFARKTMLSNNIGLYESYPDKELLGNIHASPTSPGNGNTGLLKADTILILGTNASVSHPLVENKIRKAYNAGSTILYANPYSTRTSQFSSHEILYKTGEEYHLLYAMLGGLVKNLSGLPAGVTRQFKKPQVSQAMKRCGVGEAELSPFTEALVKSRNLKILAGDNYLRNGNGTEMVQALGNLKFLKGGSPGCDVLFLGYEGNLYAGALMGAHPDFMPGFDHVNDARSIRKWNRNWNAQLNNPGGLNLNEMLANTGKEGILAIITAGDIPSGRQLKKVKFLVQLNMFLTGLSEYADVFLPVTGFLENEGHYMTAEGKIKKLRKIVSAQGKSKTIPAILSDIAEVMNEPLFQNARPGTIWKEIKSSLGITVQTSAVKQNKFLPMKPGAGKGAENRTGIPESRYNHFRYRGNDLISLVPDLKAAVSSIMDENIYHG